MVRRALRQQGRSPRPQTAIGQSLPAPTGGWDASSPIAEMPINSALILDNWIPRAGYVELRRGFVPQVTGTGAVESMMAYRGGVAGDLLFAASGGNLYDVTIQGAPLGAPVFTGATNNRWNYTAFANAAGNWIIAANGSDAPIGYNAGAWGALPAITGAGPPALGSSALLFNVFAHKGRLYFLEKNSLRVWNPAAGAVGGACTLLDLSSIFSKGGRLVCGGNWSAQFGLTADDFAVFMTDQGQVAIYQGIDPTNAATFTLLGVYDLGPPLGPKAMLKYGGDLAIVTTDGIVPLSQAMRLDRSQENQVAMTAKILDAFSAAVRAYGANYGWQGILYPGNSPSSQVESAGGSLAIFNIPMTALGTSVQFVQNVLTGAWCRFTDINAFCWEIANGGIYFGGQAGVYQWDQGSSDNGVAIVGDVKGAFTDFGRPGREKQFTMIRPLLKTVAEVRPALEIDVDYQESEPTAVPTVVQQGGSVGIRYDWTGASGIGYVGAPRMQVNLLGDASADLLAVGDAGGNLLAIDGAGDNLLVETNLPFDVPCQLLGFDVMFEMGGSL